MINYNMIGVNLKVELSLGNVLFIDSFLKPLGKSLAPLG